jgi:hypothetical protein
MTDSQIDWERLGRFHDAALISALKSLLASGGPFKVSADTLASETSRSEEEAENLLQSISPPLTPESLLRCPNCGFVLSNEESQAGTCSNCHQQFVEYGGVQTKKVFVFDAPRTRDVAWVLALHGMNTRGAWQEEFNWRVSTAYGRSVPVAIYKYGLVRPGAIWRPSLNRKVNKLIAKIQVLAGDAGGNGFAGRPDIVAHSLGTWLIGHALLQCPSLKVGHVILTGSILRPDFDWGTLLARGQVEAVLNHYGSRDFWSGISQFLIPDSGPSGRRGFNPGSHITQVCAPDFGHSDFFTLENLPRVFTTVWQPFLTDQITISAGAETETLRWLPPIWPFRGTLLPLLLLALYWVILASVACSCLLGIFVGYHWVHAIRLGG